MDNSILKLQKRYSILTFIIGKNYEKVREVLHKLDDVEYILVTDDDELKSDTWTVICDKTLCRFSSPYEKCFWIRYHIFEYCTTDICITIDGSMQVKGSLDALIDKFNSENYDICLMPHPIWPDFMNEYNAWIKMRGYPLKNAKVFFKLMQDANYNFQYKGLFQIGFSVKRRSKLTDNINELTWQLIQNIAIRNNEFDKLDQTVFSFVMNYFFNFVKVLPVSEQVIRSYAIQFFWHNSDNPNMNIFYDINKPDIKWMFNKQVECLYLK